MIPAVLSIAGSDSGGGAGIQADLRAIEAAGAYAATAIVAVTAQNTREVREVFPIPEATIRAQIRAVIEDLDVRAVKTGMLPDGGAIRAVADLADERPDLPLVVDPVLRAQSGGRLVEDRLAAELLERLGPRATLWTPNALEAAALTGVEVEDAAGAERAARALLERGLAAVLVKGGHLARDRGVDVFARPGATERLVAPALDAANSHGSGCALASTIAARLALGAPLDEAVRDAKRRIAEAIRHGLDIGGGPGPVDPLWRIRPGAGVEP